MRITTSMGVAGLILAVCTTFPAQVAAQECSDSDFSGRYGTMAHVALVGAGVETKDNWVAGTLVSDGAGVITEWKDTFTVVPPDSQERIVLARDAVAAAAENGEQVTYTVSPDCQIAIRVPIGPVVIELKGVLVNGGREMLNVQTNPPNAMAGGYAIAAGPSRQKEFESLQSQIDAIKELLDRIAVRNGLRP